MSGIEQAASAFDQELGNGAEVAKPESSQMPIEALFPTRAHEDDVQAGGDGEPAPRVRVAKVEKAAQREIEGEPNEEDILYGGEDDNPDGEDVEDEDDEDGPDDVEDEDDDEGDDEDDDVVYDELPENIASRKVKVISDGEEVVVPLSEAVQGYQRTETFHRRLNKLTEVAHEVETRATEVVNERAKAVDLIDQLGTQLAEFLPTEPDWDEQFKADPKKARELQKNYGVLKGKLETLAKKRQEIVEQNEKDNAKRLANFILTEKAKVESKNPHWSDPKKKARDLASMVRTLHAEGFSDVEIKQLYDSRMIAIVLKASKYDRMTAKKPQPSQRGKGPIAKSGAGRVRTAPKNLQRQQKQLAQTGRVEDAAAVFQQLLK